MEDLSDLSEISVSDREWVNSILSYSDFRGTEYCFTSLFMWSRLYGSRIGRIGDFLVLASESSDSVSVLYPAGRGSDEDFSRFLGKFERIAVSGGKRLEIIGVTGDAADRIERVWPGRFVYEDARNSYDYIYEAEKLRSLSGKKYQSKRNFIARFEELPSWSYEAIDSSNISECMDMNAEWCRMNRCSENPSKNDEMCAVKRVLSNFEALGLKGGLLRVEGRVVAYTIGEKMNSDTFIVHVEKAFSDIKGAYPMINREFVRAEAGDCVYVNREDDAGDEGLRKAKLSYHPAFMIEKKTAILK